MRIYLVRHASHALLRRVLCGRVVDIGLDEGGKAQAQALGGYFSRERIDLLQTSPRRRAQETASAIGAVAGRSAELAPALDEHDAGEWAGLEFAALARNERWQAWNEERRAVRPPRGESMRELQWRVVDHIEDTRAQQIECAVMLSHAEPIRAAIMHYRGVALDDFLQVEVEPAGIHMLHVSRTTVEVHRLSTMAIA